MSKLRVTEVRRHMKRIGFKLAMRLPSHDELGNYGRRCYFCGYDPVKLAYVRMEGGEYTFCCLECSIARFDKWRIGFRDAFEDFERLEAGRVWLIEAAERTQDGGQEGKGKKGTLRLGTDKGSGVGDR